MNTEYHEMIIQKMIEQLKSRDIDAYLIITSEGSDKMTSFLPGVGTVGNGAFVFTASGRRIAVCSKIDAQDIEQSGLFDEVRKYEDYNLTLAGLVRELNPRRVALNYSESDAFCDGLTVGRYNRFKQSLADYDFEEVSSDLFIPLVKNQACK